jgi:hypothetical protein
MMQSCDVITCHVFVPVTVLYYSRLLEHSADVYVSFLCIDVMVFNLGCAYPRVYAKICYVVCRIEKKNVYCFVMNTE